MKEFEFSTAETNLLIYTRQHLDAIFSGLLSTTVMDKHGYKVTDKTKFELNPDLTSVKVTEIEDDSGQAIRESKPKG